MTKTVSKFSFCYLHFQQYFEFLETMLIWLKKLALSINLPISDGESFVESIFDLKSTRKILLTQNRYIWNFNATDLLYTFLKDWRNALIICIFVKEFEEDWTELRPKIYLLRQSWAKYLEKIEKSSKTGQDKKSLISTFGCFFTAAAKV